MLHQTVSNPIKGKSPENRDFPSFLTKFDKNQRLLNCFRCGKCVLVASVCAFSRGNNNTDPYILQSFRQKFLQLQPKSARRLASFLLLIHGSSGLWRECEEARCRIVNREHRKCLPICVITHPQDDRYYLLTHLTHFLGCGANYYTLQFSPHALSFRICTTSCSNMLV